jgi:hypothetical protein
MMKSVGNGHPPRAGLTPHLGYVADNGDRTYHGQLGFVPGKQIFPIK